MTGAARVLLCCTMSNYIASDRVAINRDLMQRTRYITQNKEDRVWQLIVLSTEYPNKQGKTSISMVAYLGEIQIQLFYREINNREGKTDPHSAWQYGVQLTRGNY